MLKDLYSKKSNMKSPKKGREQDEEQDDEETKKRVLRMVENEQSMKEGLRMKIISSMIHNISEQKESEFKRLEKFRRFIKYKYPILSPKRSGVERANAGYVDHTETPSRIQTRWNPGTLQIMRQQSREGSPTRSRCNSIRKGQSVMTPSPLKHYRNEESELSFHKNDYPSTFAA